MAILLTSGNPLGLRALGSGGRTAVASYEQIARTLLQSLGPAHAALFAEPNRRATNLDWFANVETDSKPIRLVEAIGLSRKQGLAQLEILVRDIRVKAVSLQKSDRQDERILGDMLTSALEIPDEESVFLVGTQPVMTFWGYERDLGKPAVAPLYSLLSRRSDAIDVAATSAPQRKPVSEPPMAAPMVAAKQPMERSRPAWLIPAILWTTFSFLLLTCAVELLRGCAIGFPHSVTGWLLDYCPGAPDLNTRLMLATERSQQEQLKTEYDDLARQAGLKRQTCLVQKGKDGPISPKIDVEPSKVTPPTTDPVKDDGKDQLRIPDKKPDSLDFLEGCWRAHEGLTAIRGDVDTGKKLKVTFCFNKDGSGSRTIRYADDGTKCTGAASAAFENGALTVDLEQANCDGAGGNFQAARAQCRRGEDGIAKCDEVAKGATKPNFKNFPFTRTTDDP